MALSLSFPHTMLARWTKMAIEKEYYQYLNQVKTECDLASAGDKTVAMAMFDKAASPYHYWKEAQLLANGQPVKKELLTEKQAGTIKSFINYHPELSSEIKTPVEEITKDDASRIIGDWMKRFPLKK